MGFQVHQQSLSQYGDEKGKIGSIRHALFAAIHKILQALELLGISKDKFNLETQSVTLHG